MEDNQIINRLFDRSEQTIKETGAEYSGYCCSISFNIPTSPEDAGIQAWEGTTGNCPG